MHAYNYKFKYTYGITMSNKKYIKICAQSYIHNLRFGIYLLLVDITINKVAKL